MHRYLLLLAVLVTCAFANDAFIKNGDSEKQVREILGSPSQAGGSGNRKTLLYGKSKVLLYKGKVISFYPGELKRELETIRKQGHPAPNLRKESRDINSDTQEKHKETGVKATSPTLADLKKSRKTLLAAYGKKLLTAIKAEKKGNEARRLKRSVKAANEGELNRLAIELGLTASAIDSDFQGFLGDVTLERKLNGDLAVVTGKDFDQPLIAKGFGLEGTPMGKTGHLGLLKVTGTYDDQDTDGKTIKRLLIEPFMSRSPSLIMPTETPATVDDQEAPKDNTVGSGFFVIPGYIITSHHLIDKNEPVYVTLRPAGKQPETLKARVLASYPDETKTVSLLRVIGAPRDLYIPLSQKVSPEATVIRCGFSGKTPEDAVCGTTEATLDNEPEAGAPDTFYRFNIAMDDKTVGGPVVDTYGNLVGATVRHPNPELNTKSSGYCLKQSEIAKFLRDNGLRPKYGKTNLPVQEDMLEAVRNATVLITTGD